MTGTNICANFGGKWYSPLLLHCNTLHTCIRNYVFTLGGRVPYYSELVDHVLTYLDKSESLS